MSQYETFTTRLSWPYDNHFIAISIENLKKNNNPKNKISFVYTVFCKEAGRESVTVTVQKRKKNNNT